MLSTVYISSEQKLSSKQVSAQNFSELQKFAHQGQSLQTITKGPDSRSQTTAERSQTTQKMQLNFVRLRERMGWPLLRAFGCIRPRYCTRDI